MLRYILILIVLFPLAVYSQTGVVKGRVYDVSNNEPLPFVNVILVGTQIGAATDLDGNFQIFGLKPGYIRLQSSYIGYKVAISSEIEVSNANVANISIPMTSAASTLDVVTVKASPFRKTDESPVSLRSIGLSEIETNPGSNRDISRVIQSFPGVGSTPNFRNDIIIRGGGPSESRFYLDEVEVPNINHFATQGSSGGPVGIINSDFIREVNYYSGAFPADKGNALSGVFEFSQVDGNSDKLKFRGSLGASEVSATFDGPIGEKTTYIVSVRRSYLQLLFSALKLPFLPTFNDMQFKVKTRIDKKNEISFVGLGAIDQFALNTGIKNPNDQQAYILSQLPVNEQWTYTIGGVYKHFHETGFSSIVLSRNHLNNQSYKYFENDESSEDNLTLDYSSQEIENKLRFENTNRAWETKFSYGVSFEAVNYLNNTFQKSFVQGNPFEIRYNTDLNLYKWGAFAQASRNFLAERLVASVGLRVDANNYSSSMQNLLNQFSPRISLSYNITDEWSVNMNTGRYFQLPPYTTLGFKVNNEFVNKTTNNLKYISVDHFIVGAELRPNRNLQFSAEAFLKRYQNYPFSVNDKISLANKGADYGVYGAEEVVSKSRGNAYGFELLGRVINLKNMNTNLSYTFVRSEFQDLNSNLIPSSWDSKHLLTLTSTMKFKNEWSAGAKWRFVGGLPYTPFDYEKSAIVAAWDVQGGPYLNFDQLNKNRYAPFHQLDVRVDKKFYLKRVTAKFYIDIQNLYNFQSVQQDIVLRQKDNSGNYIKTDNGTKYQLRNISNTSGTVLPTIGIIIEL